MKYSRFIALGDSMTEGMSDEQVNGKYRGWADRTADELAKAVSGFTYMNLAVRGKLLQQVIEDQIPLVAPYVTGKETLISFHAGANDVIRPNYDPTIAKPKYRKGVADLVATGGTVVLFTVVEKVDGKSKVAQLWHERFSDFNDHIRTVAKELGAILMEAQEAPFLGDRRLLNKDRLHLNPEGHWRLSQGVLQGLGYPFDSTWKNPLPVAPKKSKLKVISENGIWIWTFVLPWIWRRARGKSSGDGRVCKYPLPITWKSHS
jgi:lysophospholipase L1-like esterase